MNKSVAAEGQEIAAAQALLEAGCNAIEVAGRRRDRSSADGKVNLLAVGRRRNQKERTNAENNG
jgi:hypothetical protein